MAQTSARVHSDRGCLAGRHDVHCQLGHGQHVASLISLMSMLLQEISGPVLMLRPGRLCAINFFKRFYSC